MNYKMQIRRRLVCVYGLYSALIGSLFTEITFLNSADCHSCAWWYIKGTKATGWEPSSQFTWFLLFPSRFFRYECLMQGNLVITGNARVFICSSKNRLMKWELQSGELCFIFIFNYFLNYFSFFFFLIHALLFISVTYTKKDFQNITRLIWVFRAGVGEGGRQHDRGSQLIWAGGWYDHEPGALAGEQTHTCCAIWERYTSVTAAQGSQKDMVFSSPAAQREPFHSGMLNQQNSVGMLGCARH